ncbi:MAG: OmpA family protein [Calditrichia bacterium]|jgi:outer membrane protein OmpA-like peptidoglycan-associated protein|nr:OmpA family protein [Calditrichia bacterium]
MMFEKRFIPRILVVLILTCSSVLFAQDAKESIFGDVQKKIDEAREQGAELLSPEFYKQAVENFQEANKLYLNNESTRDVREKLTEADRNCTRAMEVVNLAKITLKEPMIARVDALNVQADQLAAELFKEGENKFFEAATEIEDGDIEDARDKGSDSEEFFRKAELKAIKGAILGEARNLVNKARDQGCLDVAPSTFQYAQNLLNETEELLTNNRYAKEDATIKAEECEYQARHAMYLTQLIETLSDDERNWEKLQLGYEDILTGFATQFNENPRYDAGMNDAVNTIQSNIIELQTERDRLRAEVTKLQEEYDVVREEATLSSAELAKVEELESKIKKIKSLFTPGEAKVAYDSESLVIRLHGLTFPSGKSIIQPEYFSLLSKVQEAIKIFPDRHILLEGHTDSQGNAATNKRLSEERASAVREYIIANMGISREQITSVGFGSEKPVASNKTTEGRALNRRIDVVINLSD